MVKHNDVPGHHGEGGAYGEDVRQQSHGAGNQTDRESHPGQRQDGCDGGAHPVTRGVWRGYHAPLPYEVVPPGAEVGYVLYERGQPQVGGEEGQGVAPVGKSQVGALS